MGRIGSRAPTSARRVAVCRIEGRRGRSIINGRQGDDTLKPKFRTAGKRVFGCGTLVGDPPSFLPGTLFTGAMNHVQSDPNRGH